MTSSLEFYSHQVNAPMGCITSVCVYIGSWCMAWILSIIILCLFCWNFKNFPKLTNSSPKWRHLLIFYSHQVNAPKDCITSVYVFISSWCMAWILSIIILCLFCWNFKNFPKLTNTSPKWRHLLYFFRVMSMPLRFVLHPFVFL